MIRFENILKKLQNKTRAIVDQCVGDRLKMENEHDYF
jgi:hypothetical protein